MRTDFSELLDGHESFQDGPVFDFDMACKIDIIGQDDPVSEAAVVGDVYVGHEQAIASDYGLVGVGGTSINGYELADGGAVANFNGSFFSLDFQVLRLTRDNGSGVDFTVFSDACPIKDGDIRA